MIDGSEFSHYALLLKQKDIFNQLPEEDVAILAQLCGVKQFQKGERIFEKGNKSRQFFLIINGEVTISSSVETDHKGDYASAGRDIARFIEGEMFGEFEFFERDVHTAYALATEDTTLLVFPRDDIDVEQIFDEYAHIFAKIYHRLISVTASRQRFTHRLISEKAGWLEELKKQMFIDKLTSVYNRMYLEDELAKNLNILGERFSLLVIKPDNFKLINDTFGHEAGDTALQAIAKRLQSILRPGDFAVRYRGNEFIILMPFTLLDEAIKCAHEMHSVMNSFDIGKAMQKQSLYQTYSIGVAAYPDHETDFLELVEKAFTKVFEQREAGGNGVRVAQAGSDELLNFLRKVGIFSALKLSELHLVAQRLQLCHFPRNTIIFKENQEGDELFIIKSGSTSVRICLHDGSEKEIALLKAGEFFGEMAIFENAPRSATCIAAEDCEILCLKKDDFFDLMKRSPHAAISIMMSMLNKTTDRLKASGQFVAQMVKWGEEASLRAVTDKLTGVFNRRYMESELEKRFEEAKNNGSPIAMIMADMDYFREVNELYSHEIGDRYIVEVAKVFRNTFRKSDIIARYGGDEFTILLPNTDLATAMRIAEDVRKNVERLDFLKDFEGPFLQLSVSFGISCYPQTAETLSELKEQADKALYDAKHAGRNRVMHAPLKQR
ncbi:MAG: diguanylate cyclase [Spirochaetes bacterium]|nr:diguanylate cyclase [Spirochaetota bacterium]